MPTQINTDRMVWIDLETFGLIPNESPIIEIGFRITDLELNTVDDFQMTVWEDGWFDSLLLKLTSQADNGEVGPKIVLDMHTESGLWEQAKEFGTDPEEAEAELIDWLRGHGIGRGDALCGSSVGSLDRPMLQFWYPKVNEMFSYRNIDNSSIKELCARYNPGLFARLNEATGRTGNGKHRVLDDIADSINEFRFYRDEFLMTEAFFE